MKGVYCSWEALTGGGAPCPVVFHAEDVRETMKLDEEQRRADAGGWVPSQHYEKAMAHSKQMKADALALATSTEELAEIVGQWPLDDMDEEEYM